ncbi:DUF4374 domain-containing protein [Roseimarinus sediminis]|uniref:DUF4374 domain-containing protein n=1 Tax=Roseimarinus sediminis TaxID=1610899 RepID=UPI003D254777
MNKVAFSLKIMLALLSFSLLFTACSEDVPEPESNTAGYVLALRSLGTNNETADYLLTAESLSEGEISAVGRGVEQQGWRYYTAAANKFFSVGYGDNNLIGYELDEEGVFNEAGKMVFERMDCMSPALGDAFVSIGAPWGGGSYDCTIQLIDVEGVAVENEVVHPLYTISENDTLNKWPTSIVLKDEYLYVSFYPLHGSTWATPVVDTAYISLFSYPELEYIKTIKDDRTGPIGYYGSSPAMMLDEAGNLYTISPASYAAGYTEVAASSGILRVNAGESEFDPDYFFDVEAISGYKVLTAAYAGKGLAVARIVPDQTAEVPGAWTAFKVTVPNFKVVILDLENQTVRDVEDIPLHGGQYSTPFLLDDGKVYLSVNDGENVNVYAVDPVTASAEKGASIDGIEVQAIYKAE